MPAHHALQGDARAPYGRPGGWSTGGASVRRRAAAHAPPGPDAARTGPAASRGSARTRATARRRQASHAPSGQVPGEVPVHLEHRDPVLAEDPAEPVVGQDLAHSPPGRRSWPCHRARPRWRDIAPPRNRGDRHHGQHPSRRLRRLAGQRQGGERDALDAERRAVRPALLLRPALRRGAGHQPGGADRRRPRRLLHHGGRFPARRRRPRAGGAAHRGAGEHGAGAWSRRAAAGASRPSR